MDESFKEVLRYLVLPRPDPEAVRLLMMSLVAAGLLIVLLESSRYYLRRRRRVTGLLRAARERGLSEDEQQLLAAVTGQVEKTNPLLVFDSEREFHRLFGPLMHSLVERAGSDIDARRKLNRLLILRGRLFGDIDHHLGQVSSTIQLKHGQKVTLEFGYDGQHTSASSLVLDVDEAAVTVANTTRGGRYCPFRKGHRFTVSFFRENDGFYQFETLALRDVDEHSPLFLLLAHAELVNRIQSRKFYRTRISIPFHFRCFAWDDHPEYRYRGGEPEPAEGLEGQVLDLGAGGIKFGTPAELGRNDMIVFDLRLTSEVTIPDVLGKVVGVERSPGDGGSIVNLRFLNIRPGDQDLIAHLIQQQRLQEDP